MRFLSICFLPPRFEHSLLDELTMSEERILLFPRLARLALGPFLMQVV